MTGGRRSARVMTVLVLGVVGVVAVIGLLAAFVGESARSRAEQPGSVANKNADGAFGFAGVLNRLGWRVGYVDERFDVASLPAEGTVVILTPEKVRRGEPAALLRWVRAAPRRRVVLAGVSDSDLRSVLVPGLTDASVGEARRPTPVGSGPLTDGIRALGTPTRVGWEPVPDADGRDVDVVYQVAEPAVPNGMSPGGGSRNGPPWFVVRRTFDGGGDVIAVRDATPLTNDGIVRGANAAFSIRLALPGVPDVRFDEFHHVPPGGGGVLDAAPADVRALTVQAMVVFALLVAVCGVRFGPALQLPDRPPPRRIGYVDAVARALQRSGGEAEAFTLVRRDLVARLLRRLRLPADTPPHDLVDGAVSLGCDRNRATAVLCSDVGTANVPFTQLAAWAAECRAVLDRPPVSAN